MQVETTYYEFAEIPGDGLYLEHSSDSEDYGAYFPFYKCPDFLRKFDELKGDFPFGSANKYSFTATVWQNADNLSSIDDINNLETMATKHNDPVAANLLNLIKNYATWHSSIQNIKKPLKIIVTLSAIAGAVFISLGTTFATTIITIGSLSLIVLSPRLIKIGYIFAKCHAAQWKLAHENSLFTIYFSGEWEHFKGRKYMQIQIPYNTNSDDIIAEAKKAWGKEKEIGD